MKLNREELLNALNLVKPGLANKEIIEQSTSFVFHDGRVFTYNDELAVSHPSEFEMDCAIQAKEFLALLGKLNDEEIDISVTDSELRINGKKRKAGIRLDADIKLPFDELEIPETWSKLPPSFMKAVSFCIFTASRDMTMPKLTCIHIKNQYVESSDNNRITRFDLGRKASKIFKKPMLIPVAAAIELKAYKPVEFAATDGWIHFRTADDTMFSCRTINDEFPHDAITEFLDVEGETVSFPDNMDDVLERAGIFAVDEFNAKEPITIAMADKRLIIRGEGYSGWFEETIRTRYKGDDFSFSIAPEYLAEILRINNEAVVGDNMLKFTGEDFVHSVLLIASDEPTEEDPDDDIPF